MPDLIPAKDWNDKRMIDYTIRTLNTYIIQLIDYLPEQESLNEV